MTPDETHPRPDAVCDGGDLDCGSGLLLIIRSAMEPLPAGGVLEVRSREISVKEDLPAWCRMVGHALLSVAERDGSDASYFLRKKDADAQLQGDLQKARDHVWQVRARWISGMQAKVAARNHAFVTGQPASFDTEDQSPSAIEYLLGAVAGALATGLQWRLSRRGVGIRNLEAVVRGRADDILVFLDVARDGNQDGNPGLREIAVAIYVDADLDQHDLDLALAETVRRCPVTQSLLRAVPVQCTARIVG